MTKTNVSRMKRWAVWCACSLAFVVANGCGSDSGPRVVRVTGTVTRHGRPVGSLLVYFEPLQNGKTSVGKVDAEGKFSLRQGVDKEGAIVGKHKVYFQFAGSTPDDEMAYQAGRLKLSEDQLALLRGCGSPTSTPLQITVSEQDPQVINVQANVDPLPSSM